MNAVLMTKWEIKWEKYGLNYTKNAVIICFKNVITRKMWTLLSREKGFFWQRAFVNISWLIVITEKFERKEGKKEEREELRWKICWPKETSDKSGTKRNARAFMKMKTSSSANHHILLLIVTLVLCASSKQSI